MRPILAQECKPGQLVSLYFKPSVLLLCIERVMVGGSIKMKFLAQSGFVYFWMARVFVIL